MRCQLCVCHCPAMGSAHLRKQPWQAGCSGHDLGRHADLAVSSGMCHMLVLHGLTLSFLICEMGIKPAPFPFDFSPVRLAQSSDLQN